MSSAPNNPADREQRERILRALDRNMLVEAAAGTGKTTAMVGRMVALLRGGRCAQIRQLAAVTFTRKAAAELRSRFQVELEQAARDATGEEQDNLQRALAELEQAFIGTIHAFCARLLRERPVEAGVDLVFSEMDEETDLRLRAEAWEEFVTRQLAGQTPGLLEHLDHLGLGLGQLRAAFLRFAEYPDVDEWPLAAPRSEGGVLPDLAPVIEQLRDYAAHMRQLAPLLPADPGTDTLIRAYRDFPRVLFHHEPLDPHHPREVMAVLEHLRPKVLRPSLWARTGNFRWEDAQAEQARWERFCAEVAEPCLRAWHEHRYGPVIGVLRQASALYDRLRGEAGQLNYQDLLTRAASLLRDNPHVRRYFASRLTHLLVDEFQDTDPVQAEVLLLLAAANPDETDWRRCEPRPGALFVVGDPKQSIYRFRRADIVTYNQVRERIVATGGEVVRLSVNFRAEQDVVAWVNRVFAPLFPRAATDASPAYIPLEPGRERGLEGQLTGLRVLTIPTESCGTNAQTVLAEADRIARTIRAALDSGPILPRAPRELAAGRAPACSPADFLIVARRRANLAVYAERLTAQGIACQVTGGSALNEVPELGLLRLCLRATLEPRSPLALVAALRSELFGVSDVALHAFKRAGGGFCYTAGVPAGHPAIDDAFARLRTYQRWLSRMPPLAALERMVDDLGLLARAAARPGGHLAAGSLAQGLELLRAAQQTRWATSQLAAYLDLLVEKAEVHDGISALPGDLPAVRIMNLHKAKGLEAPVVFLADPTGEVEHDVTLHIDRGGERVQGYLAVLGEGGRYRVGPLLARPAGWAELAEREGEFLQAEARRLLYVAATRAGAMLVITRRERYNNRSPWAALEPALVGLPELPDPGPQQPPARPGVELSLEQVVAAGHGAAQRWAAVQRPTYDVRAATALAADAAAPSDAPRAPAPASDAPRGAVPAGEHGVEWGAVIHHLLQAVMVDPSVDLPRLAALALAERGMAPDLAEAAVATVRGVMGSAIWQRARRARRRLVEAPFQLLQPGEVPTVVRGVIDLVFEEPEGWVLVDHKTDWLGGRAPEAVAARYAPQLRLYAEAWQRCTGEPVRQKGVLLVRTGQFVELP